MINSAELKIKIDSLAVFSDLRNDPVMSSFRTLLDSFTVADYSNFVSALYQTTDNFSEYVRELVLRDDNFYVKAVASGKDPDAAITDAVKNELKILDEIS